MFFVCVYFSLGCLVGWVVADSLLVVVDFVLGLRGLFRFICLCLVVSLICCVLLLRLVWFLLVVPVAVLRVICVWLRGFSWCLIVIWLLCDYIAVCLGTSV